MLLCIVKSLVYTRILVIDAIKYFYSFKENSMTIAFGQFKE